MEFKTPPLDENLSFGKHLVKINREAFRRRISLTVGLDDEIRILVAKSTLHHEILKFLNLQRDWIEARLEKNAKIRVRYPKKTYSSGENFLFLGENYQLQFVEASSAMGQISLQRSSQQNSLIIEIPQLRLRKFNPQATHPDLALPIRQFYRHQGRLLIESRTASLAKEMALFPKDLSFRSQKTRWGSCSINGHLSFNWRLIVAPHAVIDYVIVHELAHLKHHNHSKDFWNLVASELPNFRELRKWLRVHHFEADFLAKKSELWI